ncbi:MAG: hypothetical protein R3D66_01850 [Alphaproteobacteria bacterium]
MPYPVDKAYDYALPDGIGPVEPGLMCPCRWAGGVCRVLSGAMRMGRFPRKAETGGRGVCLPADAGGTPGFF